MLVFAAPFDGGRNVDGALLVPLVVIVSKSSSMSIVVPKSSSLSEELDSGRSVSGPLSLLALLWDFDAADCRLFAGAAVLPFDVGPLDDFVAALLAGPGGLKGTLRLNALPEDDDAEVVREGGIVSPLACVGSVQSLICTQPVLLFLCQVWRTR